MEQFAREHGIELPGNAGEQDKLTSVADIVHTIADGNYVDAKQVWEDNYWETMKWMLIKYKHAPKRTKEENDPAIEALFNDDVM